MDKTCGTCRFWQWQGKPEWCASFNTKTYAFERCSTHQPKESPHD